MKCLFVHHSVGHNIIRDSGLRERCLAAQIELWDHDYNRIGITGPESQRLDALPIRNDNTDPDGLLDFVSRAQTDETSKEWGFVREFDLLILKSCYPNNKIPDDESQRKLEDLYAELIPRMSSLPLSAILVTTPPLRAMCTSPAAARRARAIQSYILGLGDHSVEIVDLFGMLATDRGRLAGRYAETLHPRDSHPNRRASRLAGNAIFERLVAIRNR
jgi:hypothetical protein